MKSFGKLILLAVLVITAVFIVGCSQVRSLSFENDEYFVTPEEPFSPEVKISPRNAEYTITSSNPTIAKVEDNQVIPIKEGIVSITVSAGEMQQSAKIYIIDDQEYTGNIPSYYIDYKQILFIVDNSVYSSPMQIQKDNIPGPPHNYNPPGYTLHGWYTDREYTNKFDFNQPITENVTLFGYLTLNEPKFIYDRENNLIESLMHPNLPYETIDFPENDIYGNPIKGIKANALKNNETIERITIPDNYEVIGNESFYGCASLEEVIIGQNSQLQKIGIAAFNECRELTTIHLPDTITEIGGLAFRNCRNLDITSIPPQVDTLNQYVFSNTATVGIDLENINTILEGAFDGCVSLESVTNTHKVTECYKYAFRNTKIYADSVSSEEKAAYIDTILVGAKDLTQYILLRENVTLIANNALDSKNLKNMILQIPNEIPLIGADAFEETIAILVQENYFNVGDVYYRRQVCIEHEENDFQLLKFRLSSSEYIYDIRRYFGDKVHLDLQEEFPNFTFRNVRESAFQNSDGRELKLKTLNLREVQRVFAFGVSNIESLMAVFFTRETPAVLDSSMSIARSSLAGGTLKVYVPEEYLASYTTRVTWLSLQNHIYSIEQIENDMAMRTFDNSRGFIIQYIGDEETIILPQDEDINIIADNAFMLNKSVKHITIGENIEEIGYRAFAYTEIETITFLSDEPPEINSLFLHKNSSLQKIYVPQGSTDAYIDALPYSVLIIQGIEILEIEV